VIPLFHDFSGETVLVFGGGPVGARKARRFAREARVIVVSPDFGDDDYGDAELIREAADATGATEWIRRSSPAVVVAATDDGALNAAIERAAREQGVLVNRADEGGADRGAGGVVVPATVREGRVTVAVSTGGASPALSAALRDRIEDDIAGADAMADLTAALRAELRDDGVDPTVRRDAVTAVVESDRVWKALDTPGNNVREIAADVISSVTGDST
jgi:precorrin-2 dehydrogenase/sirohydrochlorin ferrochelatase